MRPTSTGRTLRDPRTGMTFRFDSGAACLDFAHSGGEGPFSIFETLHMPEDLARWLGEPPLAAAVTEPASEKDLRDARRLRQAIWEAAQARATGLQLPAHSVAVINSAAASPPLVPSIEADAAAVRSVWVPPVLISQALSTLAREMIELLTGPLAERLRTCATEDCALVFVDSSRPNARRWCSMERCGNRQKVRALRARRVDTRQSSDTDGDRRVD